MRFCVANYSRQERLELVLLNVEKGSIILSLVKWFGGGGLEWTRNKINSTKYIACPPILGTRAARSTFSELLHLLNMTSRYGLVSQDYNSFLFLASSRLTGPTHPLIQWIPACLSTRVKLLEHETDHPSSSGDKVQMCRILCCFQPRKNLSGILLAPFFL